MCGSSSEQSLVEDARRADRSAATKYILDCEIRTRVALPEAVPSVRAVFGLGTEVIVMQRPQPIARRSHRKSKTGCKACKVRRVKCDEAKPVCRKCAVHYLNLTECDYGQYDVLEEDAAKAEAMASSSAIRNSGEQVEADAMSPPPRRFRSVSPSLLDPFRSHPECHEPELDLLMKTFFTKHIFNVFPYYPTPELNPVIQYFAPLISKDKLLLHVSILCVALQQARNGNIVAQQRARRLNKKCIDLLQERINSKSPECISDTTVCAIAALTNIENSKGNLRDAQTHLTGLKRILDIRGGLDAIRQSHATIANIVFCAFVSAANSDFPTQDTYRQLTRPDWFWNALQNDSRNSRIDYQAHGVDVEHSDLLLNLRMLATTYPTAEVCRTADEYQAALTFLTATLQRLLSLPIPQEPMTYEERMTAASHYAMVIHVFAQWSGHDPDPHLMVSIAQHKLLATLRPLLEHRVSNHLLLWLVAVGGTAPSSRVERKWFVGQLADITEDLMIGTWQEMRTKLKQVTWHEVNDEEQHRVLWEEVEIRRRDERQLQDVSPE